MGEVARAETVGSLLRPAYLLEAREARRAGTLSEADLRVVEDRAVSEAIELQESVGLDVSTDSEHRRLSWISTVNIVQDNLRPSPLGGFAYRESTRTSFMTFWRDDSGQIVRRMNAPRAFITEPLRIQRDLVPANTPSSSRTRAAVPSTRFRRRATTESSGIRSIRARRMRPSRTFSWRCATISVNMS